LKAAGRKTRATTWAAPIPSIVWIATTRFVQ
jgi:hypothetical protein